MNADTQVRWILNTRGAQKPSELRAHLERERDHYRDTSLKAGVDPRDGKTILYVIGYEQILKHMDRAIDSASALAQGEPGLVHATLLGIVRSSPGATEEGDVLRICIASAAARVE